jgi:hypothetical protein
VVALPAGNGANRGLHVRQVRTLSPDAAPECGPRILIHTRQGKVVGIYWPAKILHVETHNPRLVHQALPAICLQTSVKVVGDYGTSVAQRLAMAVDDRTMEGDLRETLDAYEIEVGDDWADVE